MKKYIITLLALLTFIPQLGFASTSLEVTSVTANDTSAISNNTYTDGWKWTFNVTVPSGEDKLQMKFADWTNSSATIPAGSNMRFYSIQSTNASTTASAITIEASNTYSTELILDPSKGQQIQVAVEIKVPTGITSGSFSTSYGIQTTGTSTADLPILNLRLSTSSVATSTMTYTDSQNSLENFAVFGIKTKDNTVGWITGLSFKIKNNEGYTPESLVSSISVGCTSAVVGYSNGVWSNGDTVTFTTTPFRLSKDWSDCALNIEPISTTSPFTLSASLDASLIKAEDNSGINLDVSSLDDIYGNEITFIHEDQDENEASLNISLYGSSPTASIIEISDVNTTDDVDLLFGATRVLGTSNVILNSIPITFTTNDGTSLSDVTDNVKLTINGIEYVESITSTTTSEIIVFKNLATTMENISLLRFLISADIKNINNSFNNGDTLQASVTTLNTTDIDIQYEDGEQLSDKTGVAIGEVKTFSSEGIALELDQITTTKTSGLSGESDIVVAKISFRVQPIGEDIYIAKIGTTTVGQPHDISTSDSDVNIETVTMQTNMDEVGDGYMVSEGDYGDFTITIVMSTEETVLQAASAIINGIAWDTISTDGADGKMYTFNLGDFRSPTVSIMKN